MQVSREQVLRYRWQRQQLNRDRSRPEELAVLDLGIQHGAGNAGRVALLNRGVPVADAVELTDDFSDPLALVWGVRGGPHFYRRADLAEVEQALRPVSENDAVRRSAGAAKAVSDMLPGWADMAAALWDATTEPATKGVVSGTLHRVLRDELQVDCRPCGVVHPHEQLFRVTALHGGVELQPGTSPPVLRRVPDWTPTSWVTGGTVGDPNGVSPRYQIARAYLRLLGPATPKDLAAYLETTVTEAKKFWPGDAVEVDRAGEKAWILPEDADALATAEPQEPERVALLNGFDLFLAAKDRHLLTADKQRHKQLWPVLGRPGALVADGELLGTWRPKTSGKNLSIRADWWTKPTKQNLATAEASATRLAEAAGHKFTGLVDP